MDSENEQDEDREKNDDKQIKQNSITSKKRNKSQHQLWQIDPVEESEDEFFDKRNWECDDMLKEKPRKHKPKKKSKKYKKKCTTTNITKGEELIASDNKLSIDSIIKDLQNLNEITTENKNKEELKQRVKLISANVCDGFEFIKQLYPQIKPSSNQGTFIFRLELVFLCAREIKSNHPFKHDENNIFNPLIGIAEIQLAIAFHSFYLLHSNQRSSNPSSESEFMELCICCCKFLITFEKKEKIRKIFTSILSNLEDCDKEKFIDSCIKINETWESIINKTNMSPQNENEMQKTFINIVRESSISRNFL